MEPLGRGDSAFGKSTDHLRDLSGNDIRSNTDDSIRADGHKREGEGIIAAQDIELWPEQEPHLTDAIWISAGFFDAHDVFTFRGKTLNGFDSYLDARAAGNAV